MYNDRRMYHLRRSHYRMLIIDAALLIIILADSHRKFQAQICTKRVHKFAKGERFFFLFNVAVLTYLKQRQVLSCHLPLNAKN